MTEKIIVALIVGAAFLYIIHYYRKLRKQKRCSGCSFSGDCTYKEKPEDSDSCPK